MRLLLAHFLMLPLFEVVLVGAAVAVGVTYSMPLMCKATCESWCCVITPSSVDGIPSGKVYTPLVLAVFNRCYSSLTSLS